VSRQTKRALIILIGVFVILTPLALSLVNPKTNLSGAAIVTDQQTDSGDAATTGDNNPPPDTSVQQDNSNGDTSAVQPAGDQGGDTAPTAIPPTAVPPTAIRPTDVPPTAISLTDIPPTVIPPTSAPEASQEPTTPAEASAEPVVGETPTAEATELVTPPPEATSEIEVTLEATSEVKITPEATSEITPEATEQPIGFAVGAACTAAGVEFTITNLGDAMTSAESYSIDGVEAGSVTLGSGESQTVTAGFGSPSLSIGDAQASVDTPCMPPPQLSVSMECTLDSGVVFTIANAGGAMQSEQDYSITQDGSEVSSGIFQLAEGVNTAIQAGFGEPSITAGDLQAQMSPACNPPAHVEGRVWQDLNNDGLSSDDEPGIAGVIVALTNDDGSTVQTVTVEDGHYDFFPVGEGHYLVQLQADSLPPDIQNTVDPDGEKDSTAGVDVAAGEVYDLNFGYLQTGTSSISGRVWLETSNFGVLDPGEKGVHGVTVQLLDTGGTVLAETGLSADGLYRFDDLSAGNYTVQLVADSLPQPYGVTFDSDSDHNLDTFVSLSSGQSTENIDFGIVGTF
jgi:hypothetical protein